MKISCQSCQAKYTIADEKVLGKIVKIRCKKCGATIVINGNEQDSTQAYDAGAAQQPAIDYTAQQGGEPWTVNVSDGDQRSLTLAEIVSAYHASTVTDETYCWKDGMADWLPLREIPELHQACNAGPQPTMNPDVGGYDHHQQQAPVDDQPTQAGFSSLFGGQQQQPQNGGGSLFGNGGGASAPAAAAAATTAARRAGGRGGGGADLFGSVAQAGGEQDVMTSASANPQAVPGGVDDKMTGARNENSVLFSLAALTTSAPEKKNDTPMAQGEGSGLIDIRALSASMENKKDGSKKVDDIMNLSGGGAFSAALAAPVLAPAPSDAADYGGGYGGGEKKKGNMGLLIGIIGGFVVVGALAAGGVFLAMKGNSTSSAATTTATTTTATPTATDTAGGGGPANTGGAVAQNDNTAATGTTTAARPGVGTTGGGAKPPTGGGNTTNGGGGTTTTGGGNNAVVPPPQTTTNTGGCAPGDLQCAMAKGAGATTAAPANTAAAGGTSPFNSGNAAAALGPIASSVGSCKKDGGPTGSGHAKITFAPSGSVSSVEIDGGPFPGTAVGGCVAGKFRGAHIGAFSGGPVTVGKSFSVN